jgi:hypothetical protein
MISLSKSQDPSNPSTVYFKDFNETNITILANLITTTIWSPIIWTNGYRLATNFKSASYLALDFDSGQWKVDDARGFAADHGLSHIIATTKSHQKEKRTASGKISSPTDRFRFIIPFNRAIDDKALYLYNMREAMQLFPSDPSCKDGARYFFPCTQIVSVRSEGNFWPVLEIPPDQTEEAVRQRAQENIQLYKDNSLLPQWLVSALRLGVDEGQRHVTCYKIGAFLYGYGKSVEEIVELCLSSPLSEIGANDVRRAIENGFTRASRRE